MLLYRALNLKPRVSWETAAAASPDDQAKAAGAVLCVEGAGTAERNGYYKEDGAPAPQPSVIANDDDDDDMHWLYARILTILAS